MKNSELHVEGIDDQFTIIHLLERHGVDFSNESRTIDVDAKGTDAKVLDGMDVAIQFATGRAVGFVIDANGDIQGRWKVIRMKLHAADVTVPSSIPRQGFIGRSERYKSNVGVWIMPDNEHSGKIEDFLTTLIAENDPLIGHAQGATAQAKEIGALFSDSDRSKAIIRAWLAWQKQPGHPYGRAIQKKYFLQESEVVDRFVAWFKQLFSIE